MGLSNYYLKNYENAIKNFSFAIQKYARDPIYYVNRSRAYRKMDDYRLAYEDLKKSNTICSDGQFHDSMPKKNE